MKNALFTDRRRVRWYSAGSLDHGFQSKLAEGISQTQLQTLDYHFQLTLAGFGIAREERKVLFRSEGHCKSWLPRGYQGEVRCCLQVKGDRAKLCALLTSGLDCLRSPSNCRAVLLWWGTRKQD